MKEKIIEILVAYAINAPNIERIILDENDCSKIADEIINLFHKPDVIKSLPKQRVVTIGHEQNCMCNHCKMLDKIFGNVL